MRKIVMNNMRIVHLGREWPYVEPPYHKSMVSFLERNERLVYWFQPEHRDATIQDQIPALKIADDFYSLSLCIMKCIYRNIRLKKGFLNVETAQLGGYKLRIPQVLLMEKTKTQARFSTIRNGMAAANKKTKDSTAAAAAPEPGVVSRGPLSAANKVTNVVFEFFLPIADRYFPRYTSFTLTPDVEEQEILEMISNVFPECMISRDAFVDTVGGIYDRGVMPQPTSSHKKEKARN